ncbi:MAG: response regulator transcription factor [Bacteroidales bacterium]|nr:response regulator transcription factor [Bacteroidales bacterium]MCL2739178.1 response regulator transcription factor [Bacteroidales bacterium]
MITVAIVDDHQVVIDGVEKNIIESGVACLTGKAYSIAGCWAMLAKSQPDVLLLDVGLPDGSGMDLCPLLKAKYPAMNVLMLTNFAEYAVISHVLNNGASGYVLKNATSEEIMEGIRVVASGKRYLCDEAGLVLKKERNKKVILTRQERELLKLLSAGLTSREIADQMCLGYETIRSYRKNLQAKLGVNNTAHLVKMAVEERLL